MEEKIIQLRNEGKSYREIEKILGCSKGTIAYHCGINQKNKTKNRTKSYRKTLVGILKRKKDNFCCVKKTVGRDRREPSKFSSNEFFEKIQSNPSCYLTGRPIDLLSPKTYQCDHIVAKSKGGNGNLENMGLACKDANIAKGNLSLDDFISLCKEILIHQGYSISKI